MKLSTEFLTYFFLVYCVAYNLFLSVSFLLFRLFPRTRKGEQGMEDGRLPIITLMIPALNEEKVLRKTVEHLVSLPYPGQLEILIIDDNSDDATGDIAHKLCTRYENVLLLSRGPERSRTGKGDALNHGFSFLRAMFPQRDEEEWIIGVFDADGRPMEEDFFIEVGRTFTDRTVAAAQCGVRIRNGYHLLAALQDVEFATFSFVTQTVRDRTSGAVALGGNGQFIRASVLASLLREGPCWDGSILTEDLDIGTRIHLQGGRIRFIDRWVEQEGVESLKALFRQRHRWAWGTLQVFLKYLLSGRIFWAKISLFKKLDLHYYLSFWIVPFVVLVSFFLSLLAISGVVEIINHFGRLFLIANSFSFVPMMVLGLLWARVPMRRILYLVPLAILYAYHWVPVLIAGWLSILSHRQPHWTKTERFVIEEPAK